MVKKVLTRSLSVLTTAPTLIPPRSGRTNLIIDNRDPANFVAVIDDANQAVGDGISIQAGQKAIIGTDEGDDPDASVMLLADTATVTVRIREVYTAENR